MFRTKWLLECKSGFREFVRFEGPGEFLGRGPSVDKVGSLMSSVGIIFESVWFVGWLFEFLGVKLGAGLFS